MNIIVFGVGKFYITRKEKLQNLMFEDTIIAFIDNKETDEKYFENIPLYKPQKAIELNFDIILLMSAKALEMKNQLLGLGVPDEKIMGFQEYISVKQKGEITLYTKSLSSTLKKKILIISTDINYNGGALMAFHSAKALKERGYEVWLATPKINQKLLYEIGKELINVAVCPALPYVSEIEMHWIKAFDKVVVNVYPMVATAAIISKVRPIIWWIHEPSEKYDNFYSTLRCWYHKYASLKDFSSAYIVAVSNIAKRNFEKYYPGRINSILTFGIPDEADNLPIAVNNGKLVFAIIGSVKELKGQQIFVEAALRILDEHYSAEFVIIGNYSKDEYSKELQDSILNISEIKLTGNLTRTELKATFNGIDVVVCASLEETMSLTIAEGMMHGKICITTDATGIADYISNGKNGFVCQVGSVESLYKTMKWVLDHRDELAVIKENARKTYEKHFTLDVLADRFEKAFEAIEEN